MKQSDNLTDEELVKSTLKESVYFRFIIERYTDKLSRYILRLTSVRKEDVEDILQDVFISVYKNLNSFDSDMKFSSWIYRITHNKVTSLWRKNKNKAIIFKNDDSLELFKNIVSKDDTLLELNNQDIQRDVTQILKKLKKEYAEILILKFLEDKSYLEISDILKKPMGTVATLINRAKKEFREVVEDMEDSVFL